MTWRIRRLLFRFAVAFIFAYDIAAAVFLFSAFMGGL